MFDILSVGFIVLVAVFFLVRKALTMSNDSCGNGCNSCSKNTCSTKDFSVLAVSKSSLSSPQVIHFQKIRRPAGRKILEVPL